LLKHRERLRAIVGAEEHLLAQGLEADIRMMLKVEHDDDPGDFGDLQLLLWPAAVRSIVVDIDRAHVFVPTRGEFVDLAATRISSSEVAAAGDYLVRKGKESIEVGKKLRLLSARWIEPGPQEYVAYCRAWIAAGDDAEALAARFESEAGMRDAFKVAGLDAAALAEALSKRIAALEAGPGE
jgi:hypothetical protein